MKRPIVLGVVLLIACMSLLSTLYVAVAQDNQAMKHVNLTGTMTCTGCQFTHGANHKCPPGCCEDCIKHGDPVLFTDNTGNQYVLVPKDHTMLMTNDRYKLLNRNVRVTGQLAQGKGVRFILVDTITKEPSR